MIFRIRQNAGKYEHKLRRKTHYIKDHISPFNDRVFATHDEAQIEADRLDNLPTALEHGIKHIVEKHHG